MDAYFFKALEGVRRSGRPMAVETTLVGTVSGALLAGASVVQGQGARPLGAPPPALAPQLVGCTSKAEFAVGVIRGFGANMDFESRSALARDVFNWVGERPPDPSAPLDCYADPSGVLRQFVLDKKASSGAELTRAEVLAGAVVVPTVTVRGGLPGSQGSVEGRPVTHPPRPPPPPAAHGGAPVPVDGAHGAAAARGARGRWQGHAHPAPRRVAACHDDDDAALLRADHRGARRAERSGSSACLQSSALGRVFRPREGDRLVLYLKDIDLPAARQVRHVRAGRLPAAGGPWA